MRSLAPQYTLRRLRSPEQLPGNNLRHQNDGDRNRD